MTWRIGPITLPQPKHCSMRFLLCWLNSQPACRVVRASMALPPTRLLFCSTCGVTWMSRHALTKPFGVVGLGAPTVTRFLGAATSASICAASVRSAVPSDVLALTLNTKPWRLSVSTRPR